jgi:hypothetical protein
MYSPGLVTDILEQATLVPFAYDYVFYGYTGDDITTIIYKQGGLGGLTVATLTIVYTNGNPISITRT